MKRILVLILSMAALVACGSATEVGNPTELPRTITGIIDEGTLPELSVAAAAQAKAVELSALNVYAAATDGTSVEAPVGIDGAFAIDVIVGKTSAFSVRRGTETIGEFSFEQNDEGGRGASLEISAGGEDVALGLCRFENGAFIPSEEPRRSQGINGAGGGGGGGGGSGNGSGYGN